jgi:hypothetical protein
MLVRFIKVGKFLHVIALMAFSLSCSAAIMLERTDLNQAPFSWYIWFAVLVIFLPMGILAELDGYSRFQNYKQVKDQLFQHGFQLRLLRPLERSSCQREAAILAGVELGIGQQVKEYYYTKGYRWYHIIPDFVFQYPLFFFSAYFWRTTFFTPYYRSRVDYANIDLSGFDLMLKGLEIEPAT